MDFYKIRRDGSNEPPRISKNIYKINLLLELDENEYIISCSECLFYFKGEILNIKKEDLNWNNLFQKNIIQKAQ